MFILFTKKLKENNPMSLHTYLHNCKLEELGMIDFNPINILTMKSEISSHPPKNGKILTQWALMSLGTTLIYKT